MGERRLGRAVDPGVLGPGARHPPARAHRARLRGRQHRAGAGAAAAPRRLRPAGHRGAGPRAPSRTPCCTCAAAASPTSWAPAPLEVLAAERTVDDAPEVLRRVRRLLAYYRTSRAGAAALDRVVRHDRLRALLHAAADGVHRRGRHRPARSPRCWASCSAWRAWRCRWAATGPSWSWRSRQSHPRGARQGRRCCGRPSTSSALLPAAGAAARGATSCWATRWWCPPYPRYLSGFLHALEPVPSLRRLRRGGGVERVRPAARTRCCCPGCRR